MVTEGIAAARFRANTCAAIAEASSTSMPIVDRLDSKSGDTP